MSEHRFRVALSWSGGRDSSGSIVAGEEAVRFSVPASMGGLGVGTNPEELLLASVGACYTTTLVGVLAEARLPVHSLGVQVEGHVTGHPGPSARFASVTVSPGLTGTASGREAEYEQAALLARQRCFIGRHLRPEVEYRLGEVSFNPEAAPSEGLLDVRSLPAPQRHHLIFARLAELAPGEALTLVNDHDPKPLRYQLEATEPGRYGWKYLEEGPQAWRVRIQRD